MNINIEQIIQTPTSAWDQKRTKLYENKQLFETMARIILDNLGTDPRSGQKSYMAAFDYIFRTHANPRD